MGPSGSGKSTLMNLLGCLDTPTSGSYWLNNKDVSILSDNELAEIRNREIGFVFQTFNLLPRSTALENVSLPLVYAGLGADDRKVRASEVLNQVGLDDRMDHRPNQLSGGQRQRVAVARALVNSPSIILADEPTGNLDSKTSVEIMKLFEEIHKNGNTIILVTHEEDIAQHAERIIRLRDGMIELARMGASITLLARNKTKLEKVMKELSTSQDQKHHFLVADFDDIVNLEAVVSDYLRKGNSFNILVNNTGGPPAGPANAAPVEEYVTAFKRHLLANQVLVKLLLPGMKALDYGRIVNVISTSVKAPLPNLGVSNTVRGAVANWSKTLSRELGEFGITVNNVLPGATETGRLSSIIDNKAQKTGQDKEKVAAAMLEQVPLKRFAKPEEVANAIAFLASPAGAYISGINVPVDGGRTPNL
ncbi:unnamed protein product [Symbiodinium sp. CCMP2456]|nr:unnamed protein product [Symbiodinium sp. CCMP2456]